MKSKTIIAVLLFQFFFVSQGVASKGVLESLNDSLNDMMPKKANLTVEEKKKISSDIYLKYDEKKDCHIDFMGICYHVQSCRLGKDGTTGYFAVVQRKTADGKGEDRVILLTKKDEDFVKHIDLPGSGYAVGPGVTKDFRDLRIGSEKNGQFFKWDGSKYAKSSK